MFWHPLRMMKAAAAVIFALSCAGCFNSVTKVKLEEHTEGVVAVAVSPDGKLLASASRDNTIKLWDMPSGGKKASIPIGASGVAFSPEGTQLAAACGGSVKVFDAASGGAKGEWKLEFAGDEVPWQVQCVAWSPDGKWLAAGGGNWVDGQGNGNGIALWEVAQPSAPPKIKIRGGAVSLAFSPDSSLVAAASGKMTTHDGLSEGYVRLYETATGNRVDAWRPGDGAQHSGGRTTAVVFSADGKSLASCSSDTEALVAGKPGLVASRSDIKVWEVPTGKSLATITPEFKQCTGLVFRPDGKSLVVSGGNPFMTMKNGAVKEFDIATGKLKSKVVDAPYLVECLALSGDGKALAWACCDMDKGGPTVAQIVHRAENRPGPPPEDPNAGAKKMHLQVWYTK